MRVAVIGASGRIGRLICHELLNTGNDVIAIDLVGSMFSDEIKFIKSSYKNAYNYKDCDIVISCVPGKFGFDCLKTVISSGKNVIDISFMPEDPYRLEELALHKDVFALVDAGWAPGLTNMIVGHEMKINDVESVKIMVGGLPIKRNLPWQYSTMFSPEDVIEEYIRKVKLVDGGRVIKKDPLTDCELVDTEIGTLEAFNTDGLRTLLRSYKNNCIVNMVEKTIRYPGYVDKINLLKDSGFFCEKEIDISGVKIKPIDMTSKMLIDCWKDDGVKDVSVMRIEFKYSNGDRKIYDVIDRYRDGLSSMSRITGYSCCSMFSLIKENEFHRVGIIAPEELPLDFKNCYSYILDFLYDVGIIIRTKG